jgi:hypothetical protein
MDMAIDQVSLFGSVAAAPQTAATDGSTSPLRLSPYGELHTPPLSWRAQLARDGRYFSFFSATLDVATTEVGHAAPVLVDVDATLVKAVAFIRNIASGSNANLKVVLDWMKIHTVLAGANGTSSFWHAQVGTTTRLSTGGVALTVTNPYTGSSTAGSDLVTAQNGPIVITAENATTRNVGQGVQRDGIEVAGDTTTFIFGEAPLGTSNVEAASGTHEIIHMPPIILDSGAEFILGRGAVAQSVAGVYKIMGGFYLTR